MSSPRLPLLGPDSLTVDTNPEKVFRAGFVSSAPFKTTLSQQEVTIWPDPKTGAKLFRLPQMKPAPVYGLDEVRANAMPTQDIDTVRPKRVAIMQALDALEDNFLLELAQNFAIEAAQTQDLNGLIADTVFRLALALYFDNQQPNPQTIQTMMLNYGVMKKEAQKKLISNRSTEPNVGAEIGQLQQLFTELAAMASNPSGLYFALEKNEDHLSAMQDLIFITTKLNHTLAIALQWLLYLLPEIFEARLDCTDINDPVLDGCVYEILIHVFLFMAKKNTGDDLIIPYNGFDWLIKHGSNVVVSVKAFHANLPGGPGFNPYRWRPDFLLYHHNKIWCLGVPTDNVYERFCPGIGLTFKQLKLIICCIRQRYASVEAKGEIIQSGVVMEVSQLSLSCQY